MSNLMNKAKDMLRKDKSDKYDNDPTYNNNPNVGGGYGNQGMNDPSVGGGYNNQGVGNQGMGQGMGSDAGYNNPNVGGGYGQSQGVGNDSRFGNDSGFANTNQGAAGYNQQGYSGSTNAGPHNSNFANKMDPRVDSDRDHRNDPTSTYGSNTSGGEYTSSTNTGSTNAGPHSSNMANKVDPRVDSDLDNRNDPSSRVGGYGQQGNYGASDANPAPSRNYNDSTGFNQGGTGLAANSRVDDQAMYQGNQQGMHEGHHKHHHHQGQQQHGAGFNQNTPAYDQSTTGQGYGNDNYNSSYTPGSGDANKTAGPHNSNMMNKLDPRVDSDMDGSKTYGGNKTHY